MGYDYQQKRANGATWGGFPMLYSDGSRTGYDESFNASPEWTYWDTTSKRAFATLQHAFSNGWKFKVGATHDETRADDKLFYPAYNDWTTGASNFDRTTGAGISPSAGLYNTERKVTGVDGYVDGPFQLFGREHQLMAGLSYNRREYANYGDYQVGGPGQTWDPFASYLNWTGKIGEPNWNPLALASEGTITQKAGYAAARLSLADPLKLIIGARYTGWKSEGEGADRAQGDHAVRWPGLRHQRDVLDLCQLHRDFPAADAEGPQWQLPRSGRWQELRSGRQGRVVRQPPERLAGRVPHRTGQRRPGHR